MSLFVIPRRVRLRLGKISLRRWGFGESLILLVGLKLEVSLLNWALLGKWCWRYVSNGNVLWKQIIERKYGEEGVGWHPCEVRGGYGVGV